MPFSYDLLDFLFFHHEKSSPRTALLRFIPDKPLCLLDICAGTGSNSLLIATRKPKTRVTALDLSVDMLKIACKKFQKANVKNVEIKIDDACNTDFADNMFDVILLSLVLHEIDEGMRKVIINEVKRILRSDGRIIIIEWAQPTTFFQRLMFSLIKSMEPKGFKVFLHTNLSEYFHTFDLMVLEKQNCNYSQVFVLAKQ